MSLSEMVLSTLADPEGGGTDGPDPLKNHKNEGFLGNTDPDPLKSHKASKPAFNVRPSMVRQRNAIKMALQWRAIESYLLSTTRKICKKYFVEV